MGRLLLRAIGLECGLPAAVLIVINGGLTVWWVIR